MRSRLWCPTKTPQLRRDDVQEAEEDKLVSRHDKVQAIQEEGLVWAGSRLSHRGDCYERKEAYTVIRGALILSIGFVLGYSKAMHEMDEIKEFAQEARIFMQQLVEQARAEERGRQEVYKYPKDTTGVVEEEIGEVTIIPFEEDSVHDPRGEQ